MAVDIHRASWQYDATADGQRLLVGTPNVSMLDSPIPVVLNWWAGLKSK